MHSNPELREQWRSLHLHFRWGWVKWLPPGQLEQPVTEFSSSLSEYWREKVFAEGLCHQSDLLKRHRCDNQSDHQGRYKLLSRRLLQQRDQHQRQHAAPGGTAHLFGHVFLRSVWAFSLLIFTWPRRAHPSLLITQNDAKHLDWLRLTKTQFSIFAVWFCLSRA